MFDVSPWVGPLGPQDGRFVDDSRKLAARSPQVFVRAAVLWLLTNAFLTVVQARLHPVIVGHMRMVGGFVPEFASEVVALVLAIFIDGWLSRWALYRIGRRHTLSISEPPLYSLQPGIWAGLASLNFLAAAARFVALMLSLAGVSPEIDSAILLVLGLTATFLGLRSIAIFYRLPQPDTFVWSVLWPPLAFIGVMVIMAMVAGQMHKFGGF